MKILRTLSLSAFFCLGTLVAVAQTATIDSNFVLHTAKGDIYGTLQTAVAKKKMPVVLIIPGSGPVDRNNNHDKLVNNTSQMMADSLANHGVASLRYDKRGIGASKAANPSEKDLRFDDYITDAEGWINILKKDKRFSRVYVMGYSEGALIGAVAAQKEQIKGLISVASTGRPIDQVLREQLKPKLSPAMMDTCNYVFDELLAGREVPKVSRRLALVARPDIQPYLISWFKYNPALEMAKVKVPVLIIEGENDGQVTKADVENLQKAVPSAKMVQIQGANHLMKKGTNEVADNISSAMNPKLPLMTEFVQAVVNFIRG
ncbi:alpha/beta hydrolase [Taibaiella soli]|uniref:Alpha/beta hydrolase n=1 Tax=Taibaiella soli TaxID=1649169 RepID=A0A2W2AJD6_9BACT|nr:alpha/beta fold hydrolase [Taibaiella soli]PZF73632.1 alpha/beta hydrolase [Taibaiella soli]